jgi:hypothetical protein
MSPNRHHIHMFRPNIYPHQPPEWSTPLLEVRSYCALVASPADIAGGALEELEDGVRDSDFSTASALLMIL